jgi:site-specific DNA recombinase
MKASTTSSTPRNVVRCAIYTRKSTEDGLEQEFNTLDAQRESAEAYITSQQHAGWVCLADRYDDGGYTGGNMERPALKRLMTDIQAGRVNCVMVYKVDRLSRSLLDFAKMMETFENHEVAFVSVTQQFNTATSMGRLVLNVLLSFAQFEREMISERTRDKIAATRRKGKWSGGQPLLGYDVIGKKLVVNPEEAERVRQILRLYLELQGLVPTITALRRRGWTTKRWTTRKGTPCGGQPFCKNTLYKLLTNVVYIGQLKYKTEVHKGEHEAIVSQEVFDQVHKLLKQNGNAGGRAVRNKYGALLRGLLRCKACNCSMTHTYSSRGNRRYRYYACSNAQKHGWKVCPSPSVPAGEIERFVVERIKSVGAAPEILQETLVQIKQQSEDAIQQRQAELGLVQKQVRDDNGELHRLTTVGPLDQTGINRLADVQERIRCGEQRLTQIHEEMGRLRHQVVDNKDVATAIHTFEPLWESLSPREQARIIELLVERVDYDGKGGNVAITFRPTGIRTLAEQHGDQEQAA